MTDYTTSGGVTLTAEWFANNTRQKRLERNLVFDQLRMLLLHDDREVRKLAATEYLSRATTSQAYVHYDNGGHLDIAYDATGTAQITDACGPPWGEYSMPATGRA
jgi:hypothetical protein